MSMNLKYCLFDFFEEGTVEIGQTNLICMEDGQCASFNNDDWDFDREALVNWTNKSNSKKGKVTKQCVARVVHFSDRRDGDLIKKRDELLESDEEATTSRSTASKRPSRRPLRFLEDELDSDTGFQPDEKKNSKKVKLAHQARDKMLLDRLAKKKELEPLNEQTELAKLTEQNVALQCQLEKVMKERDSLVAAVACLNELPELLKKMTGVRTPQSSPCTSHLSNSPRLPSHESSPKGDLSPKYASGSTKQASQYISDLMVKAFSREEMASHSLTGTSSNANGGQLAKPQISPEKMNEIFEKAASRYPSVDKKILKEAAKNKLSNERRLFKRSQLKV
ncbi:uncharacterized protein LOC135155126 [Lytechinus pictus]|uniref:uncharacterized protein LOC135155126 n=1 Tax=Lytechinus pictus TaxID=7653 RepID=UPI0030BA128A